MNQYFLLVGFGLFCLFLPSRILIVLSIGFVLLADSPLVPLRMVHLTRFVPTGALALKAIAVLALREKRLRIPHFVKVWSPFWVFASISVLYSIDPTVSAQRLLSALFVFLGFGLGLPLFFPRLRDLRALVASITVLLGAAVLYSLFLAPRESLQEFGLIQGRVSGVFNNPNTLGLLAMQASFLLNYRWETERRPLAKRLYLLAALAAAICVMISGSRAAALGLIVGLVVLAATRGFAEHRYLQVAMRSLLIVVLAFVLTAVIFPQFGSGLLRLEIGSRTLLWSRALLLASEHPIFGVGFGASDWLFLRDSLYLKSIGIFISGSHSSPLRLLVDIGIVGLLLATIGFVSTLRYSIRRLSQFHDPRLGSALVALVVASLTNSAFESWLFGFGSSSTVPFWLCLAVLSYQADAVDLRRKAAARAPAPSPLARTPYPSVVASTDS